MGALHEGHLSLVRSAVAECETVVASIFVNPTQFNDPKDLASYPRTLDADLEALASTGCKIVFLPTVEEIYGHGTAKVVAGEVASRWEGEQRPGHFDGVATVVAKLFGAVGPCMAYFGLKDLQQCAVVRDMVASLVLPIGLRLVPTVREASGLAMSSRNQRLSQEGRQHASCIYATLQESARSLETGHSIEDALSRGKMSLESQGILVEYFALVDPITMEPQATPGSRSHLIFAGVFEGVRLIDNLPVFVG